MAKNIVENNLFRFVSRRSIQRVSAEKIKKKKVCCYEPAGTPSTLHSNLLNRPRKAMLEVAQQFISSPDFVDDLENLKTLNMPIDVLEEWLFSTEKPIDYTALLQQIEQPLPNGFGKPPAEIVVSSDFQLARQRIRDSIIALSIVSACLYKHRDRLIRALRFCRLLERIADDDPELQQRGGIDKAMKAQVLLPPDVFPLPPAKVIQPHMRAIEDKEGYKEELQRIQAKSDAFRSAVKELAKLGPSDFVPPPEPPPETEKPLATLEWKPWMLTPQAIERLSEKTKGVLKEQSFDLTKDAMPEVVNALEKEIAQIGAELYKPGKPLKVIRQGDSTFVFRATEPSEGMVKKIGIEDENVTVPQSAGSVRPVGVADLMVVRQNLLRYEPGEVAHIENVLRGEYKERVHRRMSRIEEEITEEVERKEETEKDLQSTDRFELKREASETIKADTKKEAGLSISGSYGPIVSFSANASYTSNTSKEQSKSTSSTYAREVTERSVSRLEERVREVRIRRAIEEFEETNTHGIDNKENTEDHVVGIYRWVDKIYLAQIVNYGQRLLFEFIVPEPAAFYLYALINNPPGEVLDKPEPPMVYKTTTGTPCTLDGNFCRPLEPGDIRPLNYQYWIARYAVSNTEPPPPESFYITDVLTKEVQEDMGRIFDGKVIPIPDGYDVSRVKAYGYAAHAGVVGYIVVDEQKSQYAWTLPSPGMINKEITFFPYKTYGSASEEKPSGVPVSIAIDNAWGFVMNVLIKCVRGNKTLQKWQHKIYDAIMQAYKIMKSEYEERLATAAIQEGISISGRNPAQNREIEQTELKRAAVSMFTAQHFDVFDAMAGMGNWGYPEMNFAEAEAEGRYIQFFEQAFEWPQMTYLFYPYFWSQKVPPWGEPTWLDKITKIQDTDPQFEQFLKAGAARVVVPVRPGYEAAITNFVETGGEIWCGDEQPHVDDELYVSIADEIQLQQGMYIEKSEGTVAVTNGSPDVVGYKTDFSEDDVDREIIIEGERYIIKCVGSPVALTLTADYRGETTDRAHYAIGAKLVGTPWEVRIPTSLVLLQKDATLPGQEPSNENGGNSNNSGNSGRSE